MKKILKNLKDRMFRLGDDEPLSPLSILVLVLLDIFLLIILFQGLDDQSRMLTSPEEYIPYVCREIVIEKNWTANNRLNKLSEIVIGYNRSSYYLDEKPKKIHLVCEKIVDALRRVKTDKLITQLFEKRSQLITLQDEVKNSLAEVGSLPEIRTNQKYIRLSNEILVVNQQINSNKKIDNLWNIIDQSASKQAVLLKALRFYRFIFPIYEVLFQFLFLLPLLVIFYVWHKKSIKHRLQGLISTHLVIVVSIPIFLKIIQFVLDIIPQQIIKKFIDLLDSLKLIAIWYYIIIGISVGISILLIYILQKHFFNKEKIIEKRFRNKNCVSCGKKLLNLDQHCSACGADQYKTCNACGKFTYANSKYCRECGKMID